jgi:arylsulfatase I/J
MTNLVDQHIGAVVAALKAKGMYENSLITLSSDNVSRRRDWGRAPSSCTSAHPPSSLSPPLPPTAQGGPIYRNGAAGANNWPLRGGKKSNWEGGVRVNSLASGGLLPAAQRGRTLEDFVAMEDFYVTYCALAGVSPHDAKAEAAGLPPVDGLNLWPLLSGSNATGPRTEVWLGSGGAGDDDSSKDPIVQALIRADGYKVLFGNVIENTWTSAFYPNASTSWCDTCPLDCGTAAAPKCLFNILEDPTEHENLAASKPDIVAAMAARLAELQAGIFAPDRGQPATTEPCRASETTWRGFVGWFTP